MVKARYHNVPAYLKIQSSFHKFLYFNYISTSIYQMFRVFYCFKTYRAIFVHFATRMNAVLKYVIGLDLLNCHAKFSGDTITRS